MLISNVNRYARLLSILMLAVFVFSHTAVAAPKKKGKKGKKGQAAQAQNKKAKNKGGGGGASGPAPAFGPDGKITSTGHMVFKTDGVEREVYMAMHAAYSNYYRSYMEGKNRIPYDQAKKSRGPYYHEGRREQTYSAFVPESASQGFPMGLIVWNSPGGKGRVNGKWLNSIKARRIIWIGPNDTGNEIWPPYRSAAMLQAIRYAKKHFNIDENRIYIAGHSGGARVTSIFAQQMPGEITGAMMFAGLNTTKPQREALTRVRHVLFFSKDDNVATYVDEEYASLIKKYPYKYFKYLETRGFKHGLPDESWFNKAVDYLEEPLASLATKAKVTVKRLEKSRNKSQLLTALQQVALYGKDPAESEAAGEKAAAILAEYGAARDEIAAQIKGASSLQDFKDAGLAINKFKSAWGDMGKQAAITFNKQMIEAKRKR